MMHEKSVNIQAAEMKYPILTIIEGERHLPPEGFHSVLIGLQTLNTVTNALIPAMELMAMTM